MVGYGAKPHKEHQQKQQRAFLRLTQPPHIPRYTLFHPSVTSPHPGDKPVDTPGTTFPGTTFYRSPASLFLSTTVQSPPVDSVDNPLLTQVSGHPSSRFHEERMTIFSRPPPCRPPKTSTFPSTKTLSPINPQANPTFQQVILSRFSSPRLLKPRFSTVSTAPTTTTTLY